MARWSTLLLLWAPLLWPALPTADADAPTTEADIYHELRVANDFGTVVTTSAGRRLVLLQAQVSYPTMVSQVPPSQETWPIPTKADPALRLHVLSSIPLRIPLIGVSVRRRTPIGPLNGPLPPIDWHQDYQNLATVVLCTTSTNVVYQVLLGDESGIIADGLSRAPQIAHYYAADFEECGDSPIEAVLAGRLDGAQRQQRHLEFANLIHYGWPSDARVREGGLADGRSLVNRTFRTMTSGSRWVAESAFVPFEIVVPELGTAFVQLIEL